MPTTEERPRKGIYKCKNCGQVVTLDDENDKLPPCAKYNMNEYTQV